MKILITGTTSGIGRKLSEELIKKHQIIPLNRSTLDLSDQKDVQQYKMPFCDVLINNAGIDDRSSIFNADCENICKTINTNLVAPLMLCSKFAQMNPKGTIINITSSGIKTGKSDAIFYRTSKSGLNSFTNMLRNNLYGDNLRIIEIIPGSTDTRMTTSKKMVMQPINVVDCVIFALENQGINEIFVKNFQN